MEPIIIVATGVVAFFLYRLTRAVERDRASGPGSESREVAPPRSRPDLLGLLEPMASFFNVASHPKDIAGHPVFARAVDRIAASDHSTGSLLEYAAGANWPVAWLALAAIAEREDDTPVREPLLALLAEQSFWTRYFALEALRVRAEGPVLGDVLLRIDPPWVADAFLLGCLRDFCRWAETTDDSTFGEALERLDDDGEARLDQIASRLGEDLPAALREEFREWRRTRIDRDFLNSVGRLWEPGAGTADFFPGTALAAANEAIDHPGLDAVVAQLRSTLEKTPPGSVLVTGEGGVGKSVAIGRTAQQLLEDGWYVFEASGRELIAGQMWIGQLEERLKRLLDGIRGRRVVWVVPSFLELVWVGRNVSSPISVLDMIVPEVESGAIRIVGEVRSDGYETIAREQPRIRNAVQVVRLVPPSDDTTLRLARAWSAATAPGENGEGVEPIVSERVIREALQLAGQYLGETAPPGNLLDFLKRTREHVAGVGGEARRPLGVDDLLVTLAQLTGLPLNILDQRRGLDLAGLRDFFTSRVLGQPEAVGCLVDRVAMIKAGLCDPNRPQGVFLFVGPTGTGKTEIAKALAEYLFGSPDRMIRLDMSELQTSESVERLVGKAGGTGVGSSLVHRIRKEPFSVILLDEFEKAHPNVWDMFLQLFDDGRLTDHSGNTADFRHAVVIMTSNLGAAVRSGPGVGFGGKPVPYTPADTERVMRQTFRPEFLNRIDRVVVFQPLGRHLMRKLLDKELRELFERRGLRHRDWAVEWEPSAIEFLLERGFSPEFGARPLRRAVERYLLTPLAVAIVERAIPEGDSFLYVRSEDGRLAVEWIGDDAVEPLETAGDGEAPPEEVPPLRLRAIALDGRGRAAELELLQREYDALKAVIDGPAWAERKAAALDAMKGSTFWASPDRFRTLGQVEYIDRIEVGFETAGSLVARCAPDRRRGGRVPNHLVRRLAERLYLIREAVGDVEDDRPPDAYVLVEGKRDPLTDPAAVDRFARRLAGMYHAWAERRGMRSQVLEERSVSGDLPYRLVLGVAGFGAHTILARETGQHVYEVPDGERKFRRIRAGVIVVPQPDTSPDPDADEMLRQAEAASQALPERARNEVVRRYREKPSPLVRDGRREWRTGRAEAVLAGDFDLIS